MAFYINFSPHKLTHTTAYFVEQWTECQKKSSKAFFLTPVLLFSCSETPDWNILAKTKTNDFFYSF